MVRDRAADLNARMRQDRNTPARFVRLRLARPLFSYLAASVAVAVVLVYGGLVLPAVLTRPDAGGWAQLGEVSVSLIIFLTLLTLPIAALPTLAAVLAIRWTGAKRGWADIGSGAIVGAAIALFVLAQSSNEEWLAFMTLFTVAGAVGGWVYWLTGTRFARFDGAPA